MTIACPMVVTVTAAVGTTFNPSDKTVGTTLSSGDLVATFVPSAGGYEGVRTIASTSGKVYWEFTATVQTGAAASIVEGFGNATASMGPGANFLGQNTDSMGWAGDGNVYINTASVATIQGWTQGNTLCFAVDAIAELVWFRTNGGNWNNNGAANPATGANGISFATLNAGPWFAIAQSNTSGDKMTANFGATAYAQTAPSGFGNLS